MKIKFDDKYEKGHRKNPFIISEYLNSNKKRSFVVTTCKYCGRFFVKKINHKKDLYESLCTRCSKDKTITQNFINQHKDFFDDFKQYTSNNLPIPWEFLQKYNFLLDMPKSIRYDRELRVKDTCEKCQNEFNISLISICLRAEKKCFDKICDKCNASYRGKYHNFISQKIIMFNETNGIISYDNFLKYKESIPLKTNVLITCQCCKKQKLVMAQSLLIRKTRRYEQICNDCFGYGNKTGLVGLYNDIRFESSHELTFLYFCLKNKLNINRCNIEISYIFNEKIHKIHPDFIINNTIFEIKGHETDESEIKRNAIKNYCINNGYVFCYINLNMLKKISNIIFNEIKYLQQLDNNKLFILSFSSTLIGKIEIRSYDNVFDYMGFIYKIVDLKNNKTDIKYSWGRVPIDLNILKKENNISINDFCNFFVKIECVFFSLSQLINYYYKIKAIYNDLTITTNDYIPSFIQYIINKHFHSLNYQKQSKNLDDKGKNSLIEKMKNDFYNLFFVNKNVGKNIQKINLLNVDDKTRKQIVHELNNNYNKSIYNYPQSTLIIMPNSNSNKFRYIYIKNRPAVRKQKSITTIFDENDNVLKTYEYEIDLYENFNTDNFTFLGFENVKYLKITCFTRLKPTHYILTDGNRTFEFFTSKLLRKLFSITPKYEEKMLNNHISHNGFFLYIKED